MCLSITPSPKACVTPVPQPSRRQALRASLPAEPVAFWVALCLCKLGWAQWCAPHCRHGRAQPQDRSSALGEEILSAAATSSVYSPAQHSPSSPGSRVTPRQQLFLFYFVLAIKSLKEIKGTNFITWSSRQSPAGLPVPCTLDRQKHPCKGMPAQVRIDDNWCSPAPSPPPGCRLEGAEGAQRVFGGSSRPVLQEETQQAGASRTAGQGARRLSVAATQGCGSHLCS